VGAVSLPTEWDITFVRMLSNLMKSVEKVECPSWVMNDKTQSEHNRSAFGCIATKASLAGHVELTAKP
jgi:hypothetical protein